jgi:hypothetical protein
VWLPSATQSVCRACKDSSRGRDVTMFRSRTICAFAFQPEMQPVQWPIGSSVAGVGAEQLGQVLATSASPRKEVTERIR